MQVHWPRTRRTWVASSAVAALGLAAGVSGIATLGGSDAPVAAAPVTTTTPIKHVLVIFGENISYDHYFGTYPNASNTSGRPFYAAPARRPPTASPRPCAAPTRTASTPGASIRPPRRTS
jgi:phospholipase C